MHKYLSPANYARRALSLANCHVLNRLESVLAPDPNEPLRGTQLPPLMIAAFFTAAGAGLYALAHRVLTLPMTLIGSALQSVFL